jgi:hypothetical protein
MANEPKGGDSHGKNRKIAMNRQLNCHKKVVYSGA